MTSTVIQHLTHHRVHILLVRIGGGVRRRVTPAPGCPPNRLDDLQSRRGRIDVVCRAERLVFLDVALRPVSADLGRAEECVGIRSTNGDEPPSLWSRRHSVEVLSRVVWGDQAASSAGVSSSVTLTPSLNMRRPTTSVSSSEPLSRPPMAWHPILTSIRTPNGCPRLRNPLD
jgi:hypothetical protein